MPGFPLAAIGAGIGKGIEAIQEQRLRAIQEQQQRMRMEQYQQEQKALQGGFGAALSGAFDTQPLKPLDTGGLDMPSPTGLGSGGGFSPAPRGSGMSSGLRPPVGSPENERITNLIVQDESGGRNINQQVVPPGGGYNPSVGRVTGPSSASGLGQFIDSTWGEVAPKVGAGQYARAIDAPEDLQRKAISQRVADKGVGDWAPYNKTLARHLGVGSGRGSQDSGGGDIHPEVQQGLQNTLQTIPPQVYGHMSVQAMAQQIEKANPAADPAVKMMILERGIKLTAPSEQRMWDMYRMQHDDQFKMLDYNLREQQFNETKYRDDLNARRTRVTEDRAAAVADQAGQEYFTDATGQGHWVRKGEPIPAGYYKGEPKAAGGKAVNIEVVDPDGKTVYKGAAKQGPEGYLTPDGKPIEIPDGGTATLTGTGGGRQGATQINRVTGAANLLSAELKNMSELPAMSAASIFQGLEAVPGKDLGEGIKRSIAAKLTPESATDLATTFQGIARAVATLETVGAATGLVGLTEQAKVYQPMPTDTVGNVMRKFATLRQILERGLSSAASSRDVTKEQKALFETLKDEVSQSIPFTVEEVTKLSTGDQQTYRQLFSKMSKTGGAAGGLPTINDDDGYKALPPGAHFRDADGKEYQKPGKAN